MGWHKEIFLLTPLREGRLERICYAGRENIYFYSRPCGRGDSSDGFENVNTNGFLLTPLREGRPPARRSAPQEDFYFYSRPCGRGDRREQEAARQKIYFYSRPCGRGDGNQPLSHWHFLYFYSRPCGRGDGMRFVCDCCHDLFLLTPLREGRRAALYAETGAYTISTHAPAGGATQRPRKRRGRASISTHAPAGGATVMAAKPFPASALFLLTPLREGRQIGRRPELSVV